MAGNCCCCWQVVIPLLPGFEGEISQAKGESALAVFYWQLRSISHGDSCLFARLRANGIADPTRYTLQ